MNQMERRHLQWIEINRSALRHNVQQFRRLLGKRRKFLATVKANAYGHGMIEVSRIALESGADWLGVHSVEEGVGLREAGFDCPILILGYVSLDDLEEAVRQRLRLTVYNVETVERLGKITQRLNTKVSLHMKVETGTYRQGVIEQEIFSFVDRIRKHPGLKLEGIHSHFANIEDTTDHSYARYQLENYKNIIRRLEEKGVEIPIKHMSCTASAILFPKTFFNMVRSGIGLYGLWPSKETFLSCLMQKREPLELKPVLSWKARISQIKKAPQEAYIGYGCTYRTTRETLLGVIPVGYYDGYSRLLSNVSYVLISGKRAHLRGRVAMDFITVDVTDILNVELEDEAVLIGRSGSEVLSSDTLAAWAGTINYEIVTRINPHIPRIVTE